MIDYIKINHFVFDESNLFVLKHLNKYKHLSNHEIFLPNLFSKDNLKSKIIQISLNTRLQSIRSGSSVCDTKKSIYLEMDKSASKPNFLTTKLVHLKKKCTLKLNFCYKTIINNFKKFVPKIQDIQLFRHISPYVKELYLLPCIIHEIICDSDVQFLLLMDEIPIDTYTTNKKLNISLKFQKKIQLVLICRKTKENVIVLQL